MTASRTLIISKDKAAVETIQKSLAQAGYLSDDCPADIAIDLSEPLTMDYNMVFADEDMFSTKSQTALPELIGRFPEAKVILLIAQGDRTIIRSALAAGAADYISKPLDLLDVVQSIRRVSALGPRVNSLKNDPSEKEQPPRGRTIAVYSGCCGTGKTTLAVNLAIALADLGGRVCIIDADFQFGDVCRYFGINPEKTIADLVGSSVIGNANCFLTPAQANIDVLAAPLHLEQSDNITSHVFQSIIRQLPLQYSYIVIDTPAGFSDISLTAVDAADVVLLTTVLESVASVKSLRSCLDTLRSLGYTEEKIKLVVNRKGAKSPIGNQEVEKLIKQKFAAAIPNDYEAVSTAIANAKPLLDCKSAQEMERSLRVIAEAVSSNEAPQEKQSSFVQRFGSILRKRSS